MLRLLIGLAMHLTQRRNGDKIRDAVLWAATGVVAFFLLLIVGVVSELTNRFTEN
jgi:hypothetical protein